MDNLYQDAINNNVLKVKKYQQKLKELQDYAQSEDSKYFTPEDVMKLKDYEQRYINLINHFSNNVRQQENIRDRVNLELQAVEEENKAQRMEDYANKPYIERAANLGSSYLQKRFVAPIPKMLGYGSQYAGFLTRWLSDDKYGKGLEDFGANLNEGVDNFVADTSGFDSRLLGDGSSELTKPSTWSVDNTVASGVRTAEGLIELEGLMQYMGLLGKATGTGNLLANASPKVKTAAEGLGFSVMNVPEHSRYIEQQSGEFRPKSAIASGVASGLAMSFAFALGRGSLNMTEAEAMNYARESVRKGSLGLTKDALKQALNTAGFNALLNGAGGGAIKEGLALPENATDEQKMEAWKRVAENALHEGVMGFGFGFKSALDQNANYKKQYAEMVKKGRELMGKGKASADKPESVKESFWKQPWSEQVRQTREDFKSLWNETKNTFKDFVNGSEIDDNAFDRGVMDYFVGKQGAELRLDKDEAEKLFAGPKANIDAFLLKLKKDIDSKGLESAKDKPAFWEALKAYRASLNIQRTAVILDRIAEKYKMDLSAVANSYNKGDIKIENSGDVIGIIKNKLEEAKSTIKANAKSIRKLDNNFESNAVSLEEKQEMAKTIEQLKSQNYAIYEIIEKPFTYEDLFNGILSIVSNKYGEGYDSFLANEARKIAENMRGKISEANFGVDAFAALLDEADNQIRYIKENEALIKQRNATGNEMMDWLTGDRNTNPDGTFKIYPTDRPASVKAESEQPSKKQVPGSLVDVLNKVKEQKSQPLYVDQEGNVVTSIPQEGTLYADREGNISNSIVDASEPPIFPDTTGYGIAPSSVMADPIIPPNESRAISSKSPTQTENFAPRESVNSVKGYRGNRVEPNTPTIQSERGQMNLKANMPRDNMNISQPKEQLPINDRISGKSTSESPTSFDVRNTKDIPQASKSENVPPRNKMKIDNTNKIGSKAVRDSESFDTRADMPQSVMTDRSESPAIKNERGKMGLDVEMKQKETKSKKIKTKTEDARFVDSITPELKELMRKQNDQTAVEDGAFKGDMESFGELLHKERYIDESPSELNWMAEKFNIFKARNLNDLSSEQIDKTLEHIDSMKKAGVFRSQNGNKLFKVATNIKKYLLKRKAELAKAEAKPSAEKPTETKAKADFSKKTVKGNLTRMTTKANGGMEVDGQFGVVDVNDLQTATSIGETQNRNRETISSQAQINSIGNNPNPEYLIVNNPDSANGAMVITADGRVLSGNGRTLGLKMAYESGNGEKYRAYLKEHAKEFGIDPKDVDKIKNPVLVRIVDPKEGFDLKRFVKESNESQQLARNAAEIARTDAENIKGILRDFNSVEDIASSSNKEFIQKFFDKTVGNTERAMYLAEDGSLTPDGRRRVENALIASLYGDNPRLIEKLTNTTNEGIKNIANALISTARDGAKLKGEIDKGRFFDIDFTKEIGDAALAYADTIAEMKRQGIKPLDSKGNGTSPLNFYLKNMKNRLTPESKLIFGMLSEMHKSPKQTREFLQIINDVIRAHGDPQQGDLFTGKNPKPSKSQVIKEVLQEFDSRYKTDFSKRDLSEWNKSDRTLFGSRARNKVTNPVSDKDLNNFLRGQAKQITKDTGLNFKVVDSVDELRKMFLDSDITDTVEGGIHKDTVYLVKGNISKDRLPLVIAHEVAGHRGIEAIIGSDPQYKNFFERLEKASAKDKFIRDAFAEVDRLGYAKEERAREAMAKIIEKVKAEDGTLKGTAKAFVSFIESRIRRFVRKLGFKMELSKGEVYDLAIQALRRTGMKNSNKFFGLNLFHSDDPTFRSAKGEEYIQGSKYFGKENYKTMRSYKKNGNVIYDIAPRIDPEEYGDNMPAAVEAMHNITNEGDLFADLDYAIGHNADRKEAIAMLENMRDKAERTFYGDFADKVVNNCNKAIKMIENGDFKKGEIQPITIEELSKQPIKRMSHSDSQIEGWREQRKLYDRARKEKQFQEIYGSAKNFKPQWSIGKKSSIEDVGGKRRVKPNLTDELAQKIIDEVGEVRNPKDYNAVKKIAKENMAEYKDLFSTKKNTGYKTAALKLHYLTGYKMKNREVEKNFRAIKDFNVLKKTAGAYIRNNIEDKSAQANLLDKVVKANSFEKVYDIITNTNIAKEKELRQNTLNDFVENMKNLKAKKVSSSTYEAVQDIIDKNFTREEFDGLLNTNEFTTKAVSKLRDLADGIASGLGSISKTDVEVAQWAIDNARKLKKGLNNLIKKREKGSTALNVPVEKLAEVNTLLNRLYQQEKEARKALDTSLENAAVADKQQILAEAPEAKNPNSRDTYSLGTVKENLAPVTAVNSLTNDNVMAKMGKTMYRVAYENLLEGQNRQDHYRAEGYKVVDDIYQSFGKSGDLRDGMNNLNETAMQVETSKGHKYDITKGEVLAAVATYMDSETRQIIDRAGGVDFFLGAKRDSDYFTLTTEKLKEMTDSLTPLERKALKKGSRLLSQIFLPAINETHERLNGVPLRIREDGVYFPRFHVKLDESFGNGIINRDSAPYLHQQMNADYQAMLKQRNSKARPSLMLKSFPEILNSYVDQGALYIGMAEPLRHLNRVMTEGMKRELISRYGKEYVDRITTLTKNMAGMAGRTDADRGLSNRFLSNIAAAKLTPVSALKQFSSVPLASSIIDFKYLAKAALSGLSNENIKEMMELDSMVLRYRNNGIAGIIPLNTKTWEGERQLQKQGNKWYNKLVDTGLNLSVEADKRALGIIYKATKLMAEAKGKGNDRAWIEKTFMDAVRRTQNTTDLASANGWQMKSRESAYWSFLNMYQNQTQKIGNEAVRLYRGMKEAEKQHGKDSAQYKEAKGRAVDFAIGVAVMNVMAIGTGAVAGSILHKKDEKETTRQKVADFATDTMFNLTGNPILKPVMGGSSYVLRKSLPKALGGSAQRTQSEMFGNDFTNLVPDTIYTAGKIFEEINSDDPAAKKFRKITGEALRSKSFENSLAMGRVPTWFLRYPSQLYRKYFVDESKKTKSASTGGSGLRKYPIKRQRRR